ncbi:MAG TPA: N-formylglutamate deformylase [Rhizomicrobium sp.]|jgi:formiminoglutamase
MNALPPWLSLTPADAPLIVSMPHTGTEIPPPLQIRFVSRWLALKDADWWVHRLYDFAPSLGVTTLRTRLSRSTIDVNRDPSGRSLYPGQNTTELCPTTTFDGEPLYRDGLPPDAVEIARRRSAYFEPYHAALAAEVRRLRGNHQKIVLFEAHSIRSRIRRLFEGELPDFNIGTNSGASCAAELTSAIERICENSGLAHVTNGRFKGGYTTRHYGEPAQGIHAVQLELAMRGYLEEPKVPEPENWPPPYDAVSAAPMCATLKKILEACLEFASTT